ncbi:hypothetical protein FOA43_003150 [Brettanomyces nanus]|uniref:Amino acid transporter transmembrane domain-containing protein n=1 Tax=Eeniella nana TaxID=13502 RepID=A0A875S7V7_EENNA|nr:uncharacterized protein FOA43_003150 [Brettanomyces nanus]QPG75789.1 hypothetical protein FOA43_003150 [Brettanomyces nanus]
MSSSSSSKTGSKQRKNSGLTAESFRHSEDTQENLFAIGNFSAKYIRRGESLRPGSRQDSKTRKPSEYRQPSESRKQSELRQANKSSSPVISGTTQVDVKNSRPVTITGGFPDVFSNPGSFNSGVHITSITNKDVNKVPDDRRDSRTSRHSALSSSLSCSLRNKADSSLLDSPADPQLVHLVEQHLVHEGRKDTRDLGTPYNSEIEAAQGGMHSQIVPRSQSDDQVLPQDTFDSLKLKGGDVTRGIYNWVSNQRRGQSPLRRVASSGSITNTEERSRRSTDIYGSMVEAGVGSSGEDHMSVHDMLAPGGFRRNFVASKRRNSETGFMTRNFIEFLALYGHFAGEDLSEDDEALSQLDEESETEYSTDEEVSSTESEHVITSDNEAETGEDLTEMPLFVASPPASSPNVTYKNAMDTVRRGRSSFQSLGSPKTPITNGTRRKIKSHTHRKLKHLPRLRLRTAVSSSSKRKKTSTFKSLLLLLKAFIGTGIVFLPKSFSNGGLIFCNVMILIFSAVSYYCFVVLVKTTCKTNVKGYGDVGMKLYGDRFQFLILLSLTLSQLGFASTYVVFVAENFRYLAQTILDQSNGIAWFIFLQPLFFVPLSLTRSIGKLGAAALLADLFIFLGLIYIYFESSLTLIEHGVSQTSPFKSETWTLFIGTAVFAYEGIGLLIPIQESMAEPQHFDSLLLTVIVITTVVLTTLPTIAYLSFGEDVKTVVLMNFPRNTASLTIQLLYTLAILLSTPIQLFPAIKIIENYLFHTDRDHWTTKIRRNSEALSLMPDVDDSTMYESTVTPEMEYHDLSRLKPPSTSAAATDLSTYNENMVNDEGLVSGKSDWKIKWMKNLLRVFIVLLMCTISYLGSNDLDRFVSLIGSFTCVPLIYIYPPLLYLKCFEGKVSGIAKFANYAITAVGTILMVYISYQTISTW